MTIQNTASLLLISCLFCNGNSFLSYKKQHEAFVSNLKGTSVGCILSCLAHAPALILLIKLVQKTSAPVFHRDMLCLVIPLLLSITVLADYCFLSLLAILFAEICFLQLQKSTSIPSDKNLVTMLSGKSRKSFISLFKGSNVLFTCLAILAVDFRIFPRRFAKTETFGLSLMDVGVGTFIISSAITSRYARGNIARNQVTGLFVRMEWQIFQRVAVLMLGFGRMFIVKLFNYQENASEYGNNWNFFVTLFCVWTAADFLHQVFPRNSLPWLAIAVLLIYQAMLSNTSLTDFILSAPRTNFVSSNREGMCSLLGFIPLYLLAESISYHIFFCRGVESQEDEEYWSRQWDDMPVVGENIGELGGGAGAFDQLGETLGQKHGSVSIQHGDMQTVGGCSNNPTRRNPGGSFDSREGMGGLHSEHTLEGGMGRGSLKQQLGTSGPAGHHGGLDSRDRETPTASVITAGNAVGIELGDLGVLGVNGHSTGHGPGSCTNGGNENSGGGVGVGRMRPADKSGAITILGLQWRVLIPPQSKRLVKHLSALLVLLWACWVMASTVQSTSRRLTNLAFVTFTLALSMTLILLIVLADVVGGPGVKVATIENFNSWQLTIFMIANVFTGVVNMSMRTIYARPTVAFFVLIGYAFVVTGIVWILSKFRPH